MSSCGSFKDDAWFFDLYQIRGFLVQFCEVLGSYVWQDLFLVTHLRVELMGVTESGFHNSEQVFGSVEMPCFEQ